MTDWYDKIEDYLENRLPPAEKTAFESALESDSDLASEVQAARLEMDAGEILVEKNLRQKALGWERERLKNLEKRKSGRQKWALALAAVLLLSALFWWLLRPGEKRTDPEKAIDNQPIATEQPTDFAPPHEREKIGPENPPGNFQAQNPETPKPQNRNFLAAAEKRYEPPMLSPLRGDENAGAEHPFNRALAAFQKNDFETAAGLLAAPGDNWLESGIFLRGHARFRARRFERAAADFRLLTERNSLIYNDEAQWNLALCYLALQPKFEMELKKLLADQSVSGQPKFAELRQILR